MHHRLWIRALAGVTLLAGCNAVLGIESQYRYQPIEQPTTCAQNIDCSGGFSCLFQTCSKPCHTDGECPDGQRCLPTETSAGSVCVTNEHAACDGTPCPAGTFCSSDGECRTSCVAKSSCLSDQSCSDSACRGIERHDPPRVVGDGGGQTGAGGTDASAGGNGGASSGGASNAGGASGAGGTSNPSSGGANDVDAAPARCGDGAKNAVGEACDDGANNGKPNHCDNTCAFVCTGACPLRVDSTRAADAGAADGLTWATAFPSLQDAVDAQNLAGGGEIWVRTATLTATTADPLLTMKAYTSVYGGFAGTERSRADRAAVTRQTATVLDGKALATTIVVGAGAATLEGFVVTNGKGLAGAGLTAKSTAAFVVQDVWFEKNQASGCGAGASLIDASVHFGGCVFSNNNANTGGAICVDEKSTLEAVGSRFEQNTATVGGAIFSSGTYSPEHEPTLIITGSTFVGDVASTQNFGSGGGGAIYAMHSLLTVSDTDFQACSAQIEQGAAILGSDSTTIIANSTFAESAGPTPVIYAKSGSMIATHCTFAFNDNGCMNTCDFGQSGAILQVKNSVIANTNKTSHTFANANMFSTCTLFLGGGLGQSSTPFVAPLPDRDGNGVAEYYLVQPSVDNPCLDIGDPAAATAINLDWSHMTTSSSGCLDTSPVDAGRHYVSTSPAPKPCGG